MGSAEGRRKCCESFWRRGYEMGFEGERTLEDHEISFYAHTVSKTFKGLFRIGYEWGCRDRSDGIASRQWTGYAEYRQKKDNPGSETTGPERLETENKTHVTTEKEAEGK